MSAPLVTDALLQALDKELYDVVILNFANPDMVGHTGVLPAAVRAMETVDACVGKVADKVLSLGGKVCITADHGNLEKWWKPMEPPVRPTRPTKCRSSCWGPATNTNCIPAGSRTLRRPCWNCCTCRSLPR